MHIFVRTVKLVLGHAKIDGSREIINSLSDYYREKVACVSHDKTAECITKTIIANSMLSELIGYKEVYFEGISLFNK